MKEAKINRNWFRILVLIQAFCSPQLTLSVNVIHTKAPVVIHHGEDGNSGKGQSLDFSDNYFGYSLTFMNDSQSYKFLKSRSGSTIGTLFIGAPNEKRLRNSGVVWACEFNGNQGLRCSLLSSISVQKKTHNHLSHKCGGSVSKPYPEGEEEQWIGGSLNVVDDNLISCAPRWKLNGWKDARTLCQEESALLGACYVSESKDEAKAKVPIWDINLQLPIWMRDSSKHYYGLRSVYGFGFTSHVSNVFPTPKFFIGSPSFDYWKGAFEEYEYNRDYSTTHSFLTGNIQEVRNNNYMGYSLTSGKYLREGYNYNFVVSTAPRAENLHGVVVLIHWTDPYTYKWIGGEQFGGYFGYSVATCDLNGDGSDELLVGAPLQSPNIKSKDVFTTGCVHVYDVDAIFNSPITPTSLLKICPKVTSGSRFGAAIINMGDINYDGFEDFVVGAPYDDYGVGSIFVYYGQSRVTQISEHRPHVIRGKMFEIPGLRGFGSNLLGGSKVDIDGNKTPDLAIGTFESRHVILLRTRPVAQTEIFISFHNGESQRKESISKFLPNQRTILVKACVNHTFSVNVPRDLRLNIWTKMEIFLKDDENGNLKRSFMPEVVERQRQLSIKNGCIDQQFQANEEISEDREYSIAVKASILYNETNESNEPLSRADLTLYTTQGSQQQQPFSQDRNFENAFGQFNPYLPAPYTDFKQGSLPVSKDDCDKDGNADCTPNLDLQMQVYSVDTKGQKIPYDERSKPLIVGDAEKLIFSITLKNNGETAYSPTMIISFKSTENIDLNLLGFMWNHKSDRQRQCQDRIERYQNERTHNYHCVQPLHNNKQIEYTWTLSKIGNLILKAGTHKPEGVIDFRMQGFPSNRKTEKSFSVKITENVDLTVEDSMSGTGQSAIDPKTNNVDLIQLYVIRNSGKSSTPFGSVTAEILVPTHIKVKGKFTKVIGIVNPSRLSGQDIRCEGDFFDPATELPKGLNLDNSTKSQQSRKRRSTEKGSSSSKQPPKLQVTNPEVATLSMDDDKVITFKGCETDIGSNACQKIICSTTLESKSTREIRLHMYLLKSGKAELIKDDTLGIRVESLITISYRNMKVKTIAGRTERKFLEQKGVPAYVYLLSAAGGTILFLLLTFALFKCGFFRRKTKEQLQQLKRQTMAAADMQQFQVPENQVDQDDAAL